MNSENPSTSNKKILCSVYLLIAVFLAASLAIVVYFALLPALWSTKNPSTKTPAKGTSVVQPSSPETKEVETNLNKVFEQMEAIYKPPKVDPETPPVTDKKEENKGDLIQATTEVPEETDEVNDNNVNTEPEELELPSVKIVNNSSNPIVYEICNIFSKPNLNGNLLVFGMTNFTPSHVLNQHFQSYDSFHLFANAWSMDVYNEPSVLTQEGMYKAIIIACNGNPSNVEAIKNALRDGNPVPAPLGCRRSLILHYGRSLSSSSVKAEFKTEPFANILEFHKVLGQDEASAIVFSDKNISNLKLEIAKAFSSEPRFALFAASIGYPALRKESFLVKGKMYTLLLATSEEKPELEMSSYFRSLIEILIKPILKPKVASWQFTDQALIAIIYPTSQGDWEHFLRLEAIQSAPFVDIQDDTKSGPIILNPDDTSSIPGLGWLGWFSPVYVSALAVENLFGEALRGLCFSVYESALFKPIQAYFLMQKIWEDKCHKYEKVEFHDGTVTYEYTVYIYNPVSLEKDSPTYSRLRNKILARIHGLGADGKLMKNLNEGWKEIVTRETSYGRKLDLDILFVPTNAASINYLREIDY